MADETKFTKADIDAAVEAAVAKVSGKIEELENKNTGLLDDLKKAQREARAAKEIKPEDLAAAEERAEKAEGQLKELQKSHKEAATAREKAEKALADEQGFTQRLLIQDGLKSALISNGVKDEDFIDSLTAKFAAGAAVVVEGDQRKAMYGDKALADHIKEWAASDAGKKFVAAPANSGGGAGGSNGAGGGGKAVTQEAFDGMSPKERATHFATGGVIQTA